MTNIKKCRMLEVNWFITELFLHRGHKVFFSLFETFSILPSTQYLLITGRFSSLSLCAFSHFTADKWISVGAIQNLWITFALPARITHSCLFKSVVPRRPCWKRSERRLKDESPPFCKHAEHFFGEPSDQMLSCKRLAFFFLNWNVMRARQSWLKSAIKVLIRGNAGRRWVIFNPD